MEKKQRAKSAGSNRSRRSPEPKARDTKFSLQPDKIRQILNSLKASFDPGSITITSTNIPEALDKLVAVMNQISNASYKVFELVERQKALYQRLNDLTVDLAKCAPMTDQAITKFCTTHREITHELQALSHEVIVAHEFQDLSGQSVLKVKALLEWLDRDLRVLLPHLGVAVPEATKESEKKPDLDQAAMDALMRQVTGW
jgi:chemotaxis regulatin CheY-phosphate phosphatase CheZ